MSYQKCRRIKFEVIHTFHMLNLIGGPDLTPRIAYSLGPRNSDKNCIATVNAPRGNFPRTSFY